MANELQMNIHIIPIHALFTILFTQLKHVGANKIYVQGMKDFHCFFKKTEVSVLWALNGKSFIR